MTYKPLRFFMAPGLVLIGLGMIIGLRFLYLYSRAGPGAPPVADPDRDPDPVGAQLALFGLLAELIGNNRKLLEDIQWRTRRMELEVETGHTEKDS